MTRAAATADTATAALVQSQCIEGQFGSVSAQGVGDNCEAYGGGRQSVSGSTLSATFEVDRGACGGGGGGDGGLGAGAIAGIAIGGALLFGGLVAGAVLMSRKRSAAKVEQRVRDKIRRQTEVEMSRLRPG